RPPSAAGDGRMPAQSVSDGVWDGLPLPAMELDVHGHVQRANEAFRALDPAADAERSWLDGLTSQSHSMLSVRLIAHRDFALELQVQRPERAPQWYELTARWQGGPQTYSCVLRDATAERMAERDARAETARFSLLANSVPALIAYYEKSRLSCVYANQQ